MIKALIFDLDGTLANTEVLHFKAWRQTLINNGVEDMPFEVFLTYVGTSNEKVATDYIQSDNIPKTVHQLLTEKQDLYMQLIPEVELCLGAREVVERFHGHFAMAVASSSHEKEVRAILNHHGLEDRFEQIFCGDMVVNKKPDPEIYLKTSAALSIPAGNCLAFEDSTHGANAAKNAGMYAVAIPNDFTTDHDFTRADKVVKSFNVIDENFLTELTADKQTS